MELAADHVVARHGRADAQAVVVGVGQAVGRIGGHRHVGVHEVHRGARFDAGQWRALPAGAAFGQAQGAPADVRDAQAAAVGRGGGHGLHTARDQAQAGVFAVLLAGVEQQLRTDADAEKGSLRGDEAVDQVPEAALAQLGRGIAEGADAGQHQAVGQGLDLGGRGGNGDAGAVVFQRAHHVQQVANAVVQHGH